MRPAPLALAASLSAAACATLPSNDGGDEHLPNAGAGPFREIAQTELGNSRTAPYVMDDDDGLSRDPSVVDLDGDPATLAVAGYFARTLVADGEEPDPAAPPNAIVRYGALDGRSFDRAAQVVLAPEAAWEGGAVGAPSALRAGGEIWLYYAAAGGVGLARSADGIAFAREPAPVLGPAEGGWDAGAIPGAPGVVALPEGGLRMFYEVPGADGVARIGEARSADGMTWERLGAGPALAPAGGEDAYDGAGAGDPAPVLGTSATGRPILRVYYAARDGAGRATIGLAARYGDDGPLERAVGPVFGASSSFGPRAPWVVAYPDFALLFVTQRAGAGDAQQYPAVAAGVAPGDAALPPPEPL